jgi:hypothetical protein
MECSIILASMHEWAFSVMVSIEQICLVLQTLGHLLELILAGCTHPDILLDV